MLMAIAVIAVSNSAFGDDSRTAREKSRYYFMQGSLEAANDNMPEAYEYFKKAYETDPGYYDAAFTYGNQRLFLHSDTLQSQPELMRSLDMMRTYVDAYPYDLYATQMYGYVASRLDTVSEAIRVYERVYEKMPRETQLLMNLGDAYMMERKAKEAINAMERYERIEGKSPNVSMKKMTYMLAEDDTLGAVREVESLIKEKPGDPFGHLLKGNLYDLIGKPDSVLTAYRTAETLAPENGAVKMSLATYYREQGDSVMLDNMMYEALLTEDFELDDKLSILADYLQKIIDEKGDKSRGDYLFTVLKEQYPHEPGVLDMSARYNAAKGEFREAAEEIGYALDLDATNERYWLMLMSYLLADSRYADIVDTYERAMEHIRPSIGLKNLYASAASMLEDTTRAIAIMKKSLDDVHPGLSRGDRETIDTVRKQLNYDELQWVSSLYCMLGDIDYKSGNIDDGFVNYENSLKFIADNPLTLNNYAYFLAESDRELEKAKVMSRKALELSENNPTYLDTYAWILYKLGEYQEALDTIRLALELAAQSDDDNEEYRQHLETIEKALEK